MRINNNIMAMNTHRQYAINNGSVSKATEKLSSGYRINRAGDDAAGLAISEKMRAQIRGLNMASKNSEDAISLVQTAEGALTETHSILQRMRELSTQSASDTNQNSVDREALDAEYQQLMTEINDIASQTKFNNMALLDGTFGSSTTVDAGSTIAVGLLGVAEIELDGFDAGVAQSISVALDGAAYDITFDGVTLEDVVDPGAGGTLEMDFGGGRTASIKLADSYSAGGLDGTAVTFTVVAGSGTIQTGANSGDTLSISIDAMDSASIGISGTDVLNRTNADTALSSVNDAINSVSSQRAALGAYQNRLEHKINNLDTASENLQAAESRIRDLDMAAEMTTYTQNNILVQASTSMLAQANAAPQNVLSLLQ